MEALRVEGLHKNFGGVQALRDISFSMEVGERLGIIGPNGAGKTTLFNLLNGQLAPTSGRIYFSQQDITELAAYRRAHLGLARAFQITSLFKNLTVLENVMLALQGTKPSRFQIWRSVLMYKDMFTIIEDMLRAWALWEKKEQLARNISYGDQKRLEIVLSLASKPTILLLDEPSGGLTAAESDDIASMILDLGRNITLAIVAHDMDLLFRVAKRIIVLHHGQIIADGPPEEIRSNLSVQETYMGINEYK